ESVSGPAMRYLLDCWSSKIMGGPRKRRPLLLQIAGPLTAPRSKIDWSRIPNHFRNDFDLSEVRGGRMSPGYQTTFGWTGQTTERVRDHCERPGPVGFEKFDTNTSRGPQHFAGPPQRRNGYYSKQKISSMRLCGVVQKRLRALSKKKLRQQKELMQEPACAQNKL